MTQKLIKFIVFILTFLIIIAFIALIYGIYLKIDTNKNNKININIYDKNLYIKDTDIISDIKVINEELILLIMESYNNKYFVVYDFKNDKILKIINN